MLSDIPMGPYKQPEDLDINIRCVLAALSSWSFDHNNNMWIAMCHELLTMTHFPFNTYADTIVGNPFAWTINNNSIIGALREVELDVWMERM